MRRIILDSDDEEFRPEIASTAYRTTRSPSPKNARPAAKRKSSSSSSTPRTKTINDTLMSKKALTETCQDDLLVWFTKAKHARGMPWRKDYDPSLSPSSRSQRAYEVLVSEIMLQQTQVATVIPYYKKWMEAFPTTQALAVADIEEVNQRWKGLGYYSRAARLLQAAKKVVNDLDGRFPETALKMEKELPGVGRYTAGAVSSIVFNERSAAVDGNVQRLLSRLLALHAPLKGTNAKAGLELIWSAATDLVEKVKDSGAFNQALIELGSTVCKPTNPSCTSCPLSKGCAAYRLSRGKSAASTDIEDLCTLCEPFPDSSTSVTRYPMKVEKKKAREEACAVSVIEWKTPSDRRFMLVRRPENGLLAGLYEFPTLQLDDQDDAPKKVTKASQTLLNRYIVSPPAIHKNVDAGSVLHIFSHIRMTYHVRWVLLRGDDGAEPPGLLQPSAETEDMSDFLGSEDEEDRPKKKRKVAGSKGKKSSKTTKGKEPSIRVKWVKANDVENENISTGALKIWKKVQAAW